MGKEEYVLGQEFAKAVENEKERLQRGDFADSPLQGFNGYDTNEDPHINPILNDLDLQILALTEVFSSAEHQHQKRIQNSLNQQDIYTLLAYVRRVTTLTIRNAVSIDFPKNLLNTIAMIDVDRCDYRDLLVGLSFAQHSITFCQLSESELYSDAIAISLKNTGEIIKGFTKRKHSDRSTENMAGYIDVETDFGRGFVATEFEDYAPKRDLLSLAFDCAKLIENDQYVRPRICIGSSLSTHWLLADGNELIKKILKGSSGTLSVRSNPKPNICERANEQMILMYIVECQNESDAQTLYETSIKQDPKSFGRIALLHENLFCILIARATTVDLEDLENSVTLMRFQKPLLNLIK